MSEEAYVKGFMAKCAELGVDPEELVKQGFRGFHPSRLVLPAAAAAPAAIGSATGAMTAGKGRREQGALAGAGGGMLGGAVGGIGGAALALLTVLMSAKRKRPIRASGARHLYRRAGSLNTPRAVARLFGGGVAGGALGSAGGGALAGKLVSND